MLRAAAVSLSSDSVSLDRAVQLDGQDTKEIPFDALVMSTGTKLSPPGSMPGETKAEGVAYLQSIQGDLKKAQKIVILGGGAVGVREWSARSSFARPRLTHLRRTLEMATDLAVIYEGQKDITLVQSRTLMPRFHPQLHEICMKRFEELGIKTVLGSRAVVPEGGYEGVKEVRTEAGKVVEADFVVSPRCPF